MKETASLILLIVLVSGCIGLETNRTITTTTISTTSTTIPLTTTTLTKTQTYYRPSINASFPLMIKDGVLNNKFNVFLNDTFLLILDKNRTKGIYEKNINITLTALRIWEEESSAVVTFNMVDNINDADLFINWVGVLPGKFSADYPSDTLGMALNYGYNCTTFWFLTGGYVYLTINTDLENLETTTHEIGHILNMGHVGNSDNIMSASYREGYFTDEEDVRNGITKNMKDTLKNIVRPELLSYCNL